MSQFKAHKALKEKKYSTWALLFILLFLAFLIGRTYQENLTMDTPNPTPPLISVTKKAPQITWATYTNSTHNFSLSYPRTWNVDMHSSNIQFVLRKKTTPETSISFFYSPRKNSFISQADAIVRETMLVGNRPVVFTDSFTGIGGQTRAYADVRIVPLGTSIYAIAVSLDENNTAEDSMTIKKILASFKPINNE